MLYITTRNDKETYTSHKAATASFAPDGGGFVPFRMPSFTPSEVSAFTKKSFNQIVAEILNLFFSSRLSSWDIDFCIGKKTAKTMSMNYRILLAEMWHNPQGSYDYVAERISAKLASCKADAVLSDWVCIAVRIAALFGVYGQLCAEELLHIGAEFDAAVSADDFQMPIAVHYARQMGLPVNTVICSSNDDSNIWDMIHRGTFNTACATDALLMGVERLICAFFGISEVHRFRECCSKKGIYTVHEERLSVLSDGFFCTVAGKNRAEATVNSVYRSNGYIIDPPTALCYGGLQDFRAGTGSSRVTLLISERSPSDFAMEISKATGISEQKLADLIKL